MRRLPQGPRVIRPWLYWIDGELVCEMHPPYPFWVHKPRIRNSLAKWIRYHKKCGFEGLN